MSKLCDALRYFLGNIFIVFGSKLFSQIVDIPIHTSCAPLVADLFLFCYERDLKLLFELGLVHNNRNSFIKDLRSTR